MNKTYKQLAVAFTGPSNSGKTTLIIKLSEELQKQGFKVVIVKHDPQDKAIFDKEGKDSYKFANTGANVAVISPRRTTLFKKEESSIDEVAAMFGNFDYCLVEGLKTLPLPRICVCRTKIHDDSYISCSDLVVIGEDVKESDILQDIESIKLNNIRSIVQWINKNAKTYKENIV